MTHKQLWRIVDRLERAGLCKVSEYTGAMDPDLNDSSGTMILVHPGVRIVGAEELADEETVPVGEMTSSGMMAGGACDPEDYLPLLGEWTGGEWQYLFVPFEEDA